MSRAAVAAAAAVVVVAAALVLAGCESPSILRSEGSAGKEIVTLATWIFGILAAVLLTVWAILVFVIITGKGRPEKDASQTKGNLRIEIVWTAIPAVIVTVLFILTLVVTDRIDMPTRGAQFTAIGRQWWWDFDYKDLGFKTPNEIYAPVDRMTSIDVESADVIHSFWVPQMGGKIDMIPGHVNHIHFVPLATGQYLGECSEFCGVQHGKMRFLFVVVTPEEYTAWVERQQRAGGQADRRGGRGRRARSSPAWAAAAATPSAARRSRAPSGRTSRTSAAAAASPPTRCATPPRTCCAGSRTRRASSLSATCPTCRCRCSSRSSWSPTSRSSK